MNLQDGDIRALLLVTGEPNKEYITTISCPAFLKSIHKIQ